MKTIRSSRWAHPLLLLLWVAIGTALRFGRLTSRGPWADEFSTIIFSLGHSFQTVPLDRAIALNELLQPLQPDPTTGIGDVIHHLLSESNHPPLYFVLSHLWLNLFPTEGGIVSIWAARSLPALFGVAAIPAMFALGNLAFRSRLVGQMAAAMMAVSPFGVFLAQEARHYTLPTLFAIASLCCLIVAARAIVDRSPLPLWVGLIWIAINTLGVATHYFFALTLCAEGIALLVLAWRQSRTKTHLQRSFQAWRRIYGVAAGTLVGCLAWLPILPSNYASDNKLTHWIYDTNPLSNWLAPIGRVLAWSISMLVALPMEITTLPLAIAIASGLLTLIFLVWALPILCRSLKLQQSQADSRLSVQVLGQFIVG
ncbi:MAG TPA: glycosyltransferase, partial [Chroococcales cyanobacterium]